MLDVSIDTFFAPRNQQVLDAVYFQKNYKIRCIARPVDSNNDAGKDSKSIISTISATEGMCPRGSDRIGAEPFTASIKYTGTDLLDESKRNMVKITIQMPHVDGMLPVISTRPLSGFKRILSNNPLKNMHVCSNLLKPVESQELLGQLSVTNFFKNETYPMEYKNDKSQRTPYPFQYDEEKRSLLTLNYYSALNLASCMWIFEGYFTMSQLVGSNACNGIASSDGENYNLTSSFGQVTVPIYVSQLYGINPSWQSFNQQTNLIMRYTYQNTQMFKNFIGSNEIRADALNIQVLSATISPKGKFEVKFSTKAKFRGNFKIPSFRLTGERDFKIVTNKDRPGQAFKLKLVSQQETYDNPKQTWKIESVFANRDFAGSYHIRLATCVAAKGMVFDVDEENCIERNLIGEDIELSFQQVNDPIASKYRLDTEFFLLSHKKQYLSEHLSLSNITSDVSFPESAPIYGRVMIASEQEMGEQFTIVIEKVFICAGSGNYIPRFDPDNELWGCLTSTNRAPLRHRFKILDKDDPESVDLDFNGAKFNAKLANDDKDARILKKIRGADGFSLDSTPLFDIEFGVHWYLHTIYMVIKGDSRVRRHAMPQLIDTEDERNKRSKREIQLLNPKLEFDSQRLGNDQGTNILYVPLIRKSDEVDNKLEEATVLNTTNVLLFVICILACVAVVMMTVYRKRSRTVIEHHHINGHAEENTASSSGGVSSQREPVYVDNSVVYGFSKIRGENKKSKPTN